MATTQVADLIVPEVFNSYVTQEIITKSNIINSNAFTVDPTLSKMLLGGGAVFNFPVWDLLDETNVNVATDDPSDVITPKKVGAKNIIVPRCIRTASWQVADVDEVFTAEDPMDYIGSRLAPLQTISLQNQALAVIKGIFANNATTTDDYHTKDSMIHDISSTSYVAGTTDFSAEALIDACATLGDNAEDVSLIITSPLVYANMKKQQLIQTIQPAEVGAKPIYMYGDARVIVNSKVPVTDGVCDTYIFGANQFKVGFGSPKKPIALDTQEGQGNGYGVTTLYSRWINAIAPNGFSYVGLSSLTGSDPSLTPSDASTSGNLANASSWRQILPRENIKMVKLVTRERASTAGSNPQGGEGGNGGVTG